MFKFEIHALLLLVVATTLVSTMPYPGGHHEHTHFIIHVPHHIHEHHHTHVKKIYIPVHKSDDHGIKHEEVDW